VLVSVIGIERTVRERYSNGVHAAWHRVVGAAAHAAYVGASEQAGDSDTIVWLRQRVCERPRDKGADAVPAQEVAGPCRSVAAVNSPYDLTALRKGSPRTARLA